MGRSKGGREETGRDQEGEEERVDIMLTLGRELLHIILILRIVYPTTSQTYLIKKLFFMKNCSVV